jgi:hypothetical protein
MAMGTNAAQQANANFQLANAQSQANLALGQGGLIGGTLAPNAANIAQMDYANRATEADRAYQAQLAAAGLGMDQAGLYAQLAGQQSNIDLNMFNAGLAQQQQALNTQAFNADLLRSQIDATFGQAQGYSGLGGQYAGLSDMEFQQALAGQQQAQNYALGQYGAGLDQAGALSNLAQQEWMFGQDYANLLAQEQINAQNVGFATRDAYQSSALTQADIENMIFGQEQSQRNELRDERAYQYQLDQDAIANARQQVLDQEYLYNQQWNRDMQLNSLLFEMAFNPNTGAIEPWLIDYWSQAAGTQVAGAAQSAAAALAGALGISEAEAQQLINGWQNNNSTVVTDTNEPPPTYSTPPPNERLDPTRFDPTRYG